MSYVPHQPSIHSKKCV